MKTKFAFLRQFIRNPRTIGSIVPSSPLLGKAMASFLPEGDDKLILELGPGTGPITRELFKSGVTMDQLVCLEQSEKLVNHMRARFPGINIIHGDACELETLLENRKVDAIVSCLPLKSIPKPIVAKIIQQMEVCLKDDGVLIQFTYNLRKKRSPLIAHFRHVGSRIIVGNVPPARVDAFQLKK